MVALILLISMVTMANGYSFQAPIDNLLYVTNSSTLFAISSSHLHQLHWSSSNRSLLLLHRRVQLHSSLDSAADDSVNVFVYDEHRQLLLVCARSTSGRCILYDANDISRTYVLDPAMETNYLGCQSGCYTFISSTVPPVIRSALLGNRVDRNGNIINSIIELRKDLLSFDLKYQLQSSDDTLITALTFIPERITMTPDENGYIYGFDHGQFTYFVLKSARLARSCQATIAMRVSYEEIPLQFCDTGNVSAATGAFFHSTNEPDDTLYLIFGNTVCMYTMNEIARAFTASRIECQAGNGFRLAYVVDSVEARPACEKALEQSVITTNECVWQPYRTNPHMNGTVSAIGKILYRNAAADTAIGFIFVQNNIVIIGTSRRHVLKFIRYNQTALHLLHEAIYHNATFNNQYVIDGEHESLIFAIGTELHRYAYNSCTLYDTCRSCISSRRYDSKPCVWHDGKCALSSTDSIKFDRGCPPSIDLIKPSNVSVNVERVQVKLIGLFEGVQSNAVRVAVNFPTVKPNQAPCVIETMTNDSLTCTLKVPNQPVEGSISVSVTPQHALAVGDTDIAGSIILQEKFNVYIPKPILVPDYGPAAGGTKIRIRNLAFDQNSVSISTVKIFLGKQLCNITKITEDEIECVNQACANDAEQLLLSVQTNGFAWQLEKIMFHCRTNPTVSDWYPKKTIVSGGLKLAVSGQNLNVVQTPMMQFVYNTSNLVFISLCDPVTNTKMFCRSPAVDPSLGLMSPFDLDVSFVMDNVKIQPDDNVILVINDPVYYPFEGQTQQIDSTSVLKLEGANLASTHSMDQIQVQIGNANNACIPFNLTETYLVCFLSKFAFSKIHSFEPDVEVRVGNNLTFPLGTVLIRNETQISSLMLVPHLSRQFGPWTITALVILSSITILSLLFVLVIFARRRFMRTSGKFCTGNNPPQYYHDVWCELGKKYQINPKNLTIGEKVGQGCFGDVYRGEMKEIKKQPDGGKALEVAVKVLRDQNVASMHEFLFEANRMKDFSHPNVLSLVGVAWDPFRKAMVLLPYMKNGDLRSYISNEKNRPTVRQLITWGIQVADGMEYLASLKFVHRDLATRNCMLDEQLVCRISDFGLSRDVVDRDYYIVPTATNKDKDGQTIQVSPRRLPIRWLSPESIESSKYTIQSDVWSFGILLWELLSRGKTPYAGIDNADVFSYVKNGYRLSQPTYCPPLLYRSAMVVCWNADATQRPSFTQLAHDIRHILHQLESKQQQQSSSADDDDTTIVERYPANRKIKRLSTTSMSSSGSIGGQYITTPHRQSENIQLLIDRGGDEEDAYAVAVNSSADVFSTTRLLPKYTEISIAEDA